MSVPSSSPSSSNNIYCCPQVHDTGLENTKLHSTASVLFSKGNLPTVRQYRKRSLNIRSRSCVLRSSITTSILQQFEYTVCFCSELGRNYFIFYIVNLQCRKWERIPPSSVRKTAAFPSHCNQSSGRRRLSR